MDEPTDADLVVLARSDDKEAFGCLVERYQTMAFSIALHLVSQPETAQDLVQEATLQAYLSLDQLRAVTRFKNWFYGIVLNVCRNWRRRQHAALLSLDVWEAYQPLMSNVDPHDMAEEQELRCAVLEAVQKLSIENRVAMLLFYYEDLSMEEIARGLHLSLAAVKSRLHKGRNQLQKQLVMLYPELTRTTSRKQRRKMMTNVRIVKVLLLVPRVLVVLLDQAGQRVLPLWLNPLDGHSIVEVDRRASPSQTPTELPFVDFAANLLRATGGTIQAVRIEELQDQLFYAKVLVNSRNGSQEVKVRLGDALALAHREGSAIVVEDSLMARLSVSLSTAQGSTLEQQLDQMGDLLCQKVGLSPATRFPEAPRIKEPQNLQFTEGLQRWSLRGSFLHDMSNTHWQDYACGTDATGPEAGAMSGYLKAQVPGPLGFADLRQAILADDYLGKRVRLSGDIKTAGVEQHAELYLRIVDRERTRANADRQQATFQGTQNWTRYETQIDVPADSVFILFGISLTGKGQVWVTNVQLESVESSSAQ